MITISLFFCVCFPPFREPAARQIIEVFYLSMAAVFRSLAWPFVRVKVGRGHECVCSIVVVDVAAAGSVAVTLAR